MAFFFLIISGVKRANEVFALGRVDARLHIHHLGQLHYLRTLCFGTSDQKWRDYASEMMNVEAGVDSAQRKNLVRAFNTGYYQEKERHFTCSEAVSVDVAALSENGRHIASMLGDPYRED